jgi:hypothetical protein
LNNEPSIFIIYLFFLFKSKSSDIVLLYVRINFYAFSIENNLKRKLNIYTKTLGNISEALKIRFKAKLYDTRYQIFVQIDF